MSQRHTDPGELRHRLAIERRQGGQDAFGQPTETWEQAAVIWAAHFSMGKAGEQVMSGRVVELHGLRYRIRAQEASKVQAGDRATCDGQKLRILAVVPAPGDAGCEWVDVICEAQR